MHRHIHAKVEDVDVVFDGDLQLIEGGHLHDGASHADGEEGGGIGVGHHRLNVYGCVPLHSRSKFMPLKPSERANMQIRSQPYIYTILFAWRHQQRANVGQVK